MNADQIDAHIELLRNQRQMSLAMGSHTGENSFYALAREINEIIVGWQIRKLKSLSDVFLIKSEQSSDEAEAEHALAEHEKCFRDMRSLQRFLQNSR